MSEPAPFFDAIADGPSGGRAIWLTASDGVRIRAGYWPLKGARGTVLLYPGRTEYIEKYGRAARDFAARGYATLAIDWRGQGLADRLLDDPMTGHVQQFSDYQRDVAALSDAATALDVPQPLHLLGHSMGGAIGLRAVMNGLPVASCVFSGPMWGIQMHPPVLRPAAWILSSVAMRTGFGHRYAPGNAGRNYVVHEAFEINKLTNDRDMYSYMQDQVRAHPELGLGGPSLRWLYLALSECRALARLPAPNLPCLTILGGDEAIVSFDRIRNRMAAWPGGRLHEVPGGRHELLMDTPDLRRDLFDQICALYDSAGAQQRQSA